MRNLSLEFYDYKTVKGVFGQRIPKVGGEIGHADNNFIDTNISSSFIIETVVFYYNRCDYI